MNETLLLVVVFGLGVMQLIQLGLVLFLWHRKSAKDERVDKLWAKVVGTNGKPGEDRMASHHDINGVNNKIEFLLARLKRLEADLGHDETFLTKRYGKEIFGFVNARDLEKD